jgi:hypothetical protein
MDNGIDTKAADEFLTAVEQRLGYKACLSYREHVRLDLLDGTVWEATVRVCDLPDHPSLPRAYAWSSPEKPSGLNHSKRRV